MVPRLFNQRRLVVYLPMTGHSSNYEPLCCPPILFPIMNPRPELYVTDDNPMSAIGVSANFAAPIWFPRIGTDPGLVASICLLMPVEEAGASRATNKAFPTPALTTMSGLIGRANVSQLAMAFPV